MAPDFLQLGAKCPLESKCYFAACTAAMSTTLLLIPAMVKFEIEVNTNT